MDADPIQKQKITDFINKRDLLNLQKIQEQRKAVKPKPKPTPTLQKQKSLGLPSLKFGGDQQDLADSKKNTSTDAIAKRVLERANSL